MRALAPAVRERGVYPALSTSWEKEVTQAHWIHPGAPGEVDLIFCELDSEYQEYQRWGSWLAAYLLKIHVYIFWFLTFFFGRFSFVVWCSFVVVFVIIVKKMHLDFFVCLLLYTKENSMPGIPHWVLLGFFICRVNPEWLGIRYYMATYRVTDYITWHTWATKDCAHLFMQINSSHNKKMIKVSNWSKQFYTSLESNTFSSQEDGKKRSFYKSKVHEHRLPPGYVKKIDLCHLDGYNEVLNHALLHRAYYLDCGSTLMHLR